MSTPAPDTSGSRIFPTKVTVLPTAASPAPAPVPVPVRRREITGISLQARLAALALRLTVRPALELLAALPPRLWPLDAADQLAGLDPRRPAAALCERVALPHCPAEWVVHADAAETDTSGPVVLYLHGGAFLLGGLNTHRPLAAEISATVVAPVFAVDYRLMPRHTIADAVADGVAGYRHLLALGYAPERISVMGDSAGGYLSFAVPLALRAAGLPLPGAIVALSPLTTLTAERKAAHPNAAADPMFALAVLEMFERYTAELHRRAAAERGQAKLPCPAEAPADALAALPPVLIQVGSTELLLADAEHMAERLAAVGVPVELQVWEGQVHVFQSAVGKVPEARRALHEIARFLWRTVPAHRARPVLVADPALPA